MERWRGGAVKVQGVLEFLLAVVLVGLHQPLYALDEGEEGEGVGEKEWTKEGQLCTSTPCGGVVVGNLSL